MIEGLFPRRIKQGQNEFLGVDMHLLHRRFFFVFNQFHGIAYVGISTAPIVAKLIWA